IEVAYHNTPLPNHADAIFVHDPVLICNKGAILLKMGKPLRRGEEDAVGQTLEQMSVPIHYRLHGDALAEAGDLLWLDEKTLLVGIGFRTNREGLRQLREALPDVTFIPVHLPYFTGPEACLHLGSIINFVDYDLAVVYESLMPVSFWQFLKAREIRFVPVPEEEWDTLGSNVLALAPSKCLLLDVNKIMQARLKDAG
ncbi:MAG: amidinotransferase, partial [bacterium]|nr:amidinotransferase [bacterium]